MATSLPDPIVDRRSFTNPVIGVSSMSRLIHVLTAFIVIAQATVLPIPAAPSSGSHSITHDPVKRQLLVTARFENPKITAKEAGWCALEIAGLPNTIEAGLPSVPVKTFMISLPRGAKVTGVRVEEGTPQSFSGKVAVNKSMMPYSWRGSDHAMLPAEAPPTLHTGSYPAARVHSNVYSLHHVPIVIVSVYPVVGFPAKGTFSFVSDTKVFINYEERSTFSGERPLFAHEAMQVRGLVDNPEMLNASVRSISPTTAGYDYLIITNSTFSGYSGPGGLNDLQTHLRTRDLRPQVVDVATIAANPEGKDLAEKIRNFIRKEYEQNGIRYVLLAADGDSTGSGAVIPARRLWSKIRSYDGTWHTLEENIPADLYYSCLDGEFDGNGNGKWGEPTDGANGGDVDLLAEVVVGRMSMKTTEDLQNIVRKTIGMSSRPAAKSVLLMGELLFSEMNLYGDDYMNQLVGTCTDHGYTTSGYGSDWSVDRLYDRGGAWRGADALSKIGGGSFTMVNHLGHSSSSYNMRLSSSQIQRFANAKPFFYYTQGCFPGNFTTNDCFIERLVRNGKGAVGAVANTCYGLGPEDPTPSSTTTPGASQMLHRRFIDSVLSGKADSMGRANQLSKEAFVGLASAQEMRWVFWDANYFGDPSLRLSH